MRSELGSGLTMEILNLTKKLTLM